MNFLTPSPLPGQSCIDAAIQHYGSAEAIFMLIDDNPDPHFKEDLLPILDHTEPLNVRADEADITVSDLTMLRYFRSNKLQVNTNPNG